ncbi:MAG TPA: tryptophan 2,3-dioxygenase family protein [Cyclobacteriaceae bacterium]|nr:tryptophan 2,3-dioxygenase family protein [Cyclobacteriaceae bacterium]
MEDKQLDPVLLEQLAKLQKKYAVMGQDLSSYLDGLLYSDYTNYWEYIHLDTLLSLQHPKTQFKDEKVFIIYHQITELYFNLILWEIEQISFKENITIDFFTQRMARINNYFRQLENSFSVMIDGMEKEQFLKFRMALLPASGFQSAQYRLIEFCSTDLINLVSSDERTPQLDPTDFESLFKKIYWRKGSTELSSGKGTLTLVQFEEKYMKQFVETAAAYKHNNLYQIYIQKFRGIEPAIKVLREFDLLANVEWPLAHLKSAGHYLHKAPEDIRATGGTNWQKYLPPRFQRVHFFPEIWSENEKDEWGKGAVLNALKSAK